MSELVGHQNSAETFQVTKAILGDILQTPLQEPPWLSLSETPVTILSRGKPSASEHIALINYPLTGRTFYDFLRYTAGDTSNPAIVPDIEDVYADWRLPDQAGRGNAANLQDMHKQLGQSWQIFETHRRKMMKGISEPDDLPPPEISSGLINREDIPETLVPTVLRGYNKDSIPFLDSLNERSKRELLDIMRRTRPNEKITAKEKKMSERELKRRIAKRTRDSARARESLRERVKEGVLQPQLDDPLIARHFAEFEFVVEGEPITVYKRGGYGNTVRPVEVYSRDFTNSIGEYTLTYQDNKFVYLRTNVFSKVLSPAVHWTTQEVTGENGIPISRRTIHTGNLPTGDIQPTAKFNPEIEMNEGADSLVGLLAAAYCSPAIRSRWPNSMGLAGSENKQAIGPAQIPVLAIIRKGDLERDPSGFLHSLESAAQR